MPSNTGGRSRLRRAMRGVCLAAGMFLLAASAGITQENPTGVTVSSTAGVPGAEASTPVYLAAASGVLPGALRLTLSFPSDLLAFRKVESDFTDALGFLIETTQRTKDDGKTTVVELDIRYKDPAKDKVLPDGPIVRVTFGIAEAAKMNTEIPVQASAVVMTAGKEPMPISPVKAYDGKVEVTGEAVFACFFYMH